MCCFSGDEPVHVAGTRIFGRLTSHAEQVLIYSMHMEAQNDVAMVLPVPTRPGGRFRFLDFSDYPTVLDDLQALFPKPMTKGGGDDDDDLFAGAPQGLAVQRVGAFDASFVPSRKDMARLDARFRIKDDAWKALPQYADWSFAVFKLAPGEHDIQPMAFQWQTRLSDQVYFPTVHIHDGRVHGSADFDHELFAQLPPSGEGSGEWGASRQPASSRVTLERTLNAVADRPVWRRELRGRMKNADQFLLHTKEPD